jgi:hypothetical protein
MMRKSRLIVTISGRAARLVPAGGGTSMIIGNLGKGSVMVLAVVLVVLAVLLGLGGLLFTAVKWLLIIAVVLLVAGVVAGVLDRRKTTSLR